MKTQKLLFLLIVTLITSSAAIAQKNSKKIDDLLKKYQEFGQFNGTVLVAEKGKVIYKKGHGMANMEWGIPNAPDTKFRIGSVTKQFTAAVIMQFVEEGKINLDGKLTDYLKDYRKDTGDKVTIHQLLNHTSGIPSYTNAEFFRNESRSPYSVKDFVKKFASGDLEFEPGSKFSYNNSGYFLLGAIIEEVSGMSYEKAVTDLIFKPLGMKNSGYDNHGPILKKRARGYQKTATGYTNAPYLDMGLPYAAGSLYSTVEDLYIWDQSLYGEKIISAASKQKMFTPGLSNYGYGFGIVDAKIGKTEKKTKLIAHGGGINGFNCLFTRAVDDKHLIVVLDNVGLGRHHQKITSSIISILNGGEYEGPKRSIAETLLSTISTDGVAAGVTQYRKLKAGGDKDYDFSEGELNTLGYQLLQGGKKKDALEIFKLNVEMFPKAANPYDSLGEIYLALDDKINGLANYKKAFELDPKNNAAKAIIDKLEGRAAKADPATFKDYVGEYEAGPIGSVLVTLEDGKLYGEAQGQQKLELVSESGTTFFVAEVGATVTFNKDANGKVTGFTINQGGQEFDGTKLK